MQQIPELLFVALDHYRYPSPYDEQRALAPLPPGVTSLLASPQNCLSDEHIADTAAALAVTEKDCRAALLRYIQLLLFDSPVDHYRVLGVERSASQELIRQHYDYLDQLLRAEWQADHGDWAALHEGAVEQAYTVLGNPASRVKYGVAQAGGGMVLVKDTNKTESPAPTTAPIAEQLEAIATPRAAPVEGAAAQPATDTEQKSESEATLGLQSETTSTTSVEPATTSGQETAAQVEAAVQEQPATSEPPSPGATYTAPEHPRRRSRVLVFAALAAVLLLGVYFNNQEAVDPVPPPAPSAASEQGTTAPATVSSTEALKPASQDVPAAALPDAAQQGEASRSSPNAVSQAEPAPISDAELAELEQAFTKHYDAGDAADFAALFAENAETSVARGREAIQSYYASIFASLRMQQLRLNAVEWQPGQARRSGSASASITAAPVGRGRPVTLANTLQFEVVRNNAGTIEIVQLKH